MDPKLAEDIYLLDRCVECGCCVASCGNFRMRPDFVGAVAINKISRFRLDPRDHRNDADYYEGRLLPVPLTPPGMPFGTKAVPVNIPTFQMRFAGPFLNCTIL